MNDAEQRLKCWQIWWLLLYLQVLCSAWSNLGTSATV